MKSFYFKKFFRKNYKSAFSLIELSIVILIVSILVTGGLAVSIHKMNNMKIEAAQKRVDTIYKALGAYLATNKALPCPASIIEVKTNSAAYGQSVGTSGSCFGTGVYSPASTNRVYGMIPVKDLGLEAEMAEDGFGSKFAYVVDKRFTLAGSATSSFGANSSNSGLMTVNEITSAGSEQIVTTEAIFLIISYGANKSGAFNANSSTQNARSSDANEMSNDLDNINTPAFDAKFTKSSKSGDVFDDTVFYKTRNALVSDFNALNLIFCDSGNANNGDAANNITYGAYTMTWPVSEYGKVVAATGPTTNVGVGKCPVGYTASVDKPTKKCGAYGAWEVGVISPCAENGSGLGGVSSSGGGSLSCTPTNGTSSTSGSDSVRKFTTVGTGTLSCSGTGRLYYLVVGGGGGGGGTVSDGGGGGGGGGGVASGSVDLTATKVFTVTVGNYGAGGGSGASGSAGSSSSISASGFTTVTATGGSGGLVGGNNAATGGASGSGNLTSKSGGVSGTCDNGHGGGGGGASMANAGNGGSLVYHNHGAGAGAAGVSVSGSIVGFSGTYGGGGGGCGGGGGSEGPKAAGGSGGGGSGGGGNGGGPSGGQVYAPVAGSANTGGGGGGGGIGKSGYSSAGGANGGTGVVVFYYTTP